MNQRIFPTRVAAILGAIMILLMVIYFGAAVYLSNVAERQLVAFLRDQGIPPSSVHWESVAVSPFWGALNIHGLKVNYEYPKGRAIRLEIERVSLRGFGGDGMPMKGEIRLEGVVIPSIPIEGSEGNVLRRYLSTTSILTLAQASGRRDLSPFVLEVAWHVTDDSIAVRFYTKQPDLLQAKMEGVITSPIAALRSRSFWPIDKMLLMSEASFQYQLFPLLAQIGVFRLELELKDLGAFERANLLRARYGYANGVAESRKDAIEHFRSDIQKKCDETLSAFFANEDACKKLAEFATAERSSLSFRFGGSRSLTVQELLGLNPQRAAFLRADFRPELK